MKTNTAPADSSATPPQEPDYAVTRDISRDAEALLIEVADALNTTLDLDALLSRVAEVVREVIDYEIFAILLLNERTQDLRMRFHIGHTPEAARLRIKVGKGVTGQSAEKRRPALVNDVLNEPNYVNVHPLVRSELAVPLLVKNRVIGVIDIQSKHLNYFTEEHERLLSLVGSRIAIAIANARLYSRVSRQAETLRVLNDISRDLTSILNLDELLKRIGDLLTRVIEYQMFSILLLDKNDQTLKHRFSLRFNENINLKHDIALGRGLVGFAALHKTAVVVPDVSKDQRYMQENPETRSELCVPLIYKDVVIGVLDLEHTRRGYYNDDHVRTMTTLAAQIAIAIENATLYERIAREEERLERDLAMAREIQLRLLPPCCPELPGASFAVRFSPATAIGGDMYDFVNYSGSRVGIAIGDVSGKGAPAALFAALVGGIVRSKAAKELSPAQMLSEINASLNERPISAQFMCMIYALWDDRQRVMRVSNSGLPRPIHCHNMKAHTIQATGLPLGLFSGVSYDEISVPAVEGDLFVFFSDGITDAEDREGNQLGTSRLDEILATVYMLSAEEVVARIFDFVTAFSAGTTPFDDETILAVKILAGGQTDIAEATCSLN